MSAVSGLGATMAGEMAEQPQVLRRLSARRGEIERSLRATVPEPAAGVLLLARGTSDNAALFGRYLLELALGVPAGLAAPSLWTRYGGRPDLSGQLLIALSQSGRTPEIEHVVRLARSAGASAVAITNEAASPLALAVDEALALEAGIERAVPATKTFTAQLAALLLIAATLARHEIAGLDRLEDVPPLQEELLGDLEPAGRTAATLAGARAVLTIGSGPLFAVAHEAALKLQETTSVPVLAYSASDFLHGPLAVAGAEVPVVCFASAGPVRADVEAAAGAAADRGAPVVWVSESRGGAGDARQLPVPAGVPEPLAALLHAIRAQQLALELSRSLGRDPDAPLGLQKVTQTR